MTIEYLIDESPQRQLSTWSQVTGRLWRSPTTTASVAGVYLTSALSRFDARQNFIETANRTASPAWTYREEDLALADEALLRLNQRQNEDIDVWAAGLAEDLGQFRD
jgi:hypothetical protein